MSAPGRFVALAADAVQDGLRNRVGLFALAAALGVGLFADRCTGVGGGSFLLNGRIYDLTSGAKLVGPLLYGTCSLLLVWVAAFLACDSLARPLSDGTAPLWLSRPVGRGTYALSRLAGSLGLTVGAGVLVLGVVAALLNARLGLAPAPALLGIVVFAANAFVVAASAMALALVLPRVVALAAVSIGIQIVVVANLLHLVADTSGGLLQGIDRFGPPLGTVLVLALSPWFSDGPAPSDWIDPVVRTLLWGGGAGGLLVLLFRRRELAA